MDPFSAKICITDDISRFVEFGTTGALQFQSKQEHQTMPTPLMMKFLTSFVPQQYILQQMEEKEQQHSKRLEN